MSSFPFHKARRGAEESGFTLVELLVAMVIAGIFATVLFQLLQGQARFTEMQTARQEAQQNTRGALELLASELRSVPSDGLEVSGANAIRYYLPRAIGISCGGSGLTSVNVVFPFLPAGTVPVGDLSSARYGMLSYNETAQQWNRGMVAGTRSGVTRVEALPATAASCPQNVSGEVSVYRLTGLNLPSAAAGTRVALFEVVQYDVGSASGVSSQSDSLWMQRGTGGVGSQQPLAGPLPQSTSLAFRYHDRTTGAVLAQPLPATARVGRIVVTLTARSRKQASREMAIETDSVTVFLRN